MGHGRTIRAIGLIARVLTGTVSENEERVRAPQCHFLSKQTLARVVEIRPRYAPAITSLTKW